MTSKRPAAYVIDITRLVSRAGRVLTGVDRVERAYLRHLLTGDAPAFGLCRTQLGYILTDAAGLRALDVALDTQSWGPVDLTSRVLPGLTPSQRACQSLIRRHAIARVRRHRLQDRLTALGPATYFNVGHSNLDKATLAAVKAAGLACLVMIHDTIPLDYPDLQRPGTPEVFAAKLRVAARYADQIITVSETAAADIARHLGGGTTVTAVPLGWDDIAPAPQPPRPPYALTLGTIEPRKNHALLLDLWDQGRPGDLDLVICGQRGWKNEAVFARLDAGITGVHELPSQSDADVRGLIKDATLLLFPSVAEGYGLPMVEAAALGTPVLCGDLAICHEVLGDYGVYLPLDDAYQWRTAIETVAAAKAPHSPRRFTPPRWEAHFSRVFSLIG